MLMLAMHVLLVVCAVYVLLAVTALEVRNTAAVLAAGAVAPFLVQWVKKWQQLHDAKAFALSVGGAFLLAILVMIYTGEITSARGWLINLPAVFGLAQLIFKTWSYAAQPLPPTGFRSRY